MLYRLIIGNFASFSSQVQFDMFPNLKRENFIHHVYHDEQGIPVLKGGALYGANGSGKSNFIHGIQFVKRFATEFNISANPEWVKGFFKSNRFRLPVLEETPMSFLIEFSNEYGAYIYSFEITEEGVAEEALYNSGLGKSKSMLIFQRHYKSIDADHRIFPSEILKVIKRQLEANPSQSVLSIVGRLHLIDDVHVQDAFDWLADRLELIEVGHQIPSLVHQLDQQEELMAFVKEVLSQIGLGIQDLSIKNESFEEWVKHADEEDKETVTRILESMPSTPSERNLSKMDRQFPHLTFTEKDGIRTVQEILFHQLGQNGYLGTMGCGYQSVGTLRLLTLIPALYYAIYQKKTIVIDEIDNSIHPILIKELIKLFEDSGSNGQLIFTTHETVLLNQHELLRPDEVWMIEKVQGSSTMYSLNDFKIHKTLSLENGYLDGRFGAIPFLGSIDILSNEDR